MRSFGAIGARVYSLFRRRAPHNRVVVDLLDLTADDHALEVGCGPGRAVALAAEQIGPERVAAVDPSETFVGMVRRRVPGVDVRVAGAEDLPFADGTFTVIWSIASMHHWPDRSAGLATVTAKLAAGGRMVIAERLIDAPGHGITPAEAVDVADELGRLGCEAVSTSQHPSGPRTILAIHASKPH